MPGSGWTNAGTRKAWCSAAWILSQADSSSDIVPIVTGRRTRLSPWAPQGARVAPRPGGRARMPPDGEGPGLAPGARRVAERRATRRSPPAPARPWRDAPRGLATSARRPAPGRPRPRPLGLPRDRGLAERPGVLGPVGPAHPAEPVLGARLDGEVVDRRLVRLDAERGAADAAAHPRGGGRWWCPSWWPSWCSWWVPCLVSAGRGLRRTGRSPGFGVRRCGPRGVVRRRRRRPRRCRPRTRRTRWHPRRRRRGAPPRARSPGGGSGGSGPRA